jgi:hypothetical protein
MKASDRVGRSLGPGAKFDLPCPSVALLVDDVELALRNRVRIGRAFRLVDGSGRARLRMAPSTTRWAT